MEVAIYVLAAALSFSVYLLYKRDRDLPNVLEFEKRLSELSSRVHVIEDDLLDTRNSVSGLKGLAPKRGKYGR